MKLSPKKHKIMTMIARGYTDKEIACCLNISKRTVQTHITNIIAGLNARNRTNAVVLYMLQNPQWEIL